jgi:hypothetical protein
MKITFGDKYALSSETFGINFEAFLDGHRILCLVSTEALQDLDPSNITASPEVQFLAHRSQLQSIAESKIRAALPTRVAINSADVHP